MRAMAFTGLVGTRVLSMYRLFICIIPMLAILAGCGGGLTADLTSDYDALVNDGWLKYNQSKYDESYRIFMKAVASEPTRAEAYIGEGWSLLRRQRPDSAAVVFKICMGYISSPADSVDAVCGLAGSYLASGNNNKVVTITKDYPISDIESGFPLRKHDFLLEAGHLEVVQAMAFYRLGYYSAAEKADPDNATYHLNKALAVPYTYDNPQNLMSKMTEYLNRSDGEDVL